MMFFGLPMAILHFSLFFTDQDLAKIENLESAHSNKIHGKNENNPLVLKGILYRCDLDTWTVWINDTCISSRKQQSIQGWTIVKVSQDSVVLVSAATGQKKELFLDQYGDDNDAPETVLDAHEHESALFTETPSESDDEEDQPSSSDGWASRDLSPPNTPVKNHPDGLPEAGQAGEKQAGQAGEQQEAGKEGQAGEQQEGQAGEEKEGQAGEEKEAGKEDQAGEEKEAGKEDQAGEQQEGQDPYRPPTPNTKSRPTR